MSFMEDEIAVEALYHHAKVVAIEYRDEKPLEPEMLMFGLTSFLELDRLLSEGKPLPAAWDKKPLRDIQGKIHGGLLHLLNATTDASLIRQIHHLIGVVVGQ